MKKRMKQIPMFPRDKHDAPIMVHFTRQQASQVRRAAAAAELSVGAYVRRAVVSWMNSNLNKAART